MGNKESVEKLFIEAKNFEKEGKYSDAIKSYEKLIEIDPGNPEAHFNLGLICMKAFQKDIEVDALLEDKTDEKAWALRAIGEFKKVLEIDPQNEGAKKNTKIIQEVMELRRE